MSEIKHIVRCNQPVEDLVLKVGRKCGQLDAHCVIKPHKNYLRYAAILRHLILDIRALSELENIYKLNANTVATLLFLLQGQ